MADIVKLVVAALILSIGIGAYYFYSDQLAIIRILAVLFAAGIAAVIAARTQVGALVLEYGRGALIEVRKVVWPTRKETVQTTLVVMAMVVVMGVLLWLFDMFLSWGVQFFTGQGS